jgi:hypothetical protein
MEYFAYVLEKTDSPTMSSVKTGEAAYKRYLAEGIDLGFELAFSFQLGRKADALKAYLLCERYATSEISGEELAEEVGKLESLVQS